MLLRVLLRVGMRAEMLWIGGTLWRRVLMRDGGALGHGAGGRGMLGALGGQVSVGVGRWLERADWGECWLLWSGGIDLR